MTSLLVFNRVYLEIQPALRTIAHLTFLWFSGYLVLWFSRGMGVVGGGCFKVIKYEKKFRRTMLLMPLLGTHSKKDYETQLA